MEENKKFTGNAEFKYPDGSNYQGEWKDGKKSGFGTMAFANYDIYEGDWEDDKMNGVGTYRFWDKKLDKFTSRYVGTFKDGARNGAGRMVYPDRSEYHGMWQNNMRTGEGIRIFANGDCFHGLWKFNKIVRGVLALKNGDKYDGEFKDGLFEGYGKYFWKDGSWYEGTWKDGKPFNGKKLNMDGSFAEINEGGIE